MTGFASGKYAYRISDRSGFRYRLKDTRKEWNGSIVGKDEYESKHPQLELSRIKVDAEAIRNARPDRTEPSVENLLGVNPFKISNLGGVGSGSAGTVQIQVTEKNQGRSDSDTVRFRNCNGVGLVSKALIESASGYSIGVVNTNGYTISITIDSGIPDSSTLNVIGGGDRVSAGPVTLSS